MPETSIMHFVRYPADTIYILAENQDVIVAQLVEWGKKWRADTVDVCDGSSVDEENDWEFRDYVAMRLRRPLRQRRSRSLWGEEIGKGKDAVLISYWWD
jgi:hypothetical protein